MFGQAFFVFPWGATVSFALLEGTREMTGDEIVHAQARRTRPAVAIVAFKV
jgi:hypothetical protein